MPKPLFNLTLSFVLAFFILAGCATPLPPTYGVTGSGRVLEGPILALAGEESLIVAANHDGLFIKTGDKQWERQEVTGLRKFSKITSLAVLDGVVYVGSDGEGLHILSDGTWDVRTSRDGGLADDGVLSMAVDGPLDGLPGKALWVGTRKGVAALRDGQWKVYKPEGDWLVSMTGGSGVGTGKVFVAPGFKLGARGDDSRKFKPPVSAIAAGPDQVIFGNRMSSLAIVKENSTAILKLGDEHKFSRLEMGEGVVWAGTDAGLLWGGLRGVAAGKPWPANRAYVNWSGTLLGSRNTSEFEYRWKMLGYNAARVVGLSINGPDIWAAYRATGSRRHRVDRKVWATNDTELMPTDPITDVRRYVNVDEYIARRQKSLHESYGSGEHIRGEPSALYVQPDGRQVWVGTTKGLWELDNY